MCFNGSTIKIKVKIYKNANTNELYNCLNNWSFQNKSITFFYDLKLENIWKKKHSAVRKMNIIQTVTSVVLLLVEQKPHLTGEPGHGWLLRCFAQTEAAELDRRRGNARRAMVASRRSAPLNPCHVSPKLSRQNGFKGRRLAAALAWWLWAKLTGSSWTIEDTWRPAFFQC